MKLETPLSLDGRLGWWVSRLGRHSEGLLPELPDLTEFTLVCQQDWSVICLENQMGLRDASS